MIKPKLISFKLCHYVQRSVITLKEKNIPFDIEYIDLANKPDWFLKISPLGRVPALQVGEEVLFESAVINEYLNEVTPPSLHPKDPLVKAKHRSWTEFASSLLADQYMLCVSIEEKDYLKYRESIKNKFEQLENILPDTNSDIQYFAGLNFHLVDTAFAPFFGRIKYLIDVKPDFLDLYKGLPKLEKWVKTLLNKTSVKESVLPEVPAGFIQYIKNQNSYLGGIL